MAAPKKDPDEKRTEKIDTRLTPHEKQKVLASCSAAGLTESEFTRRRILDYRVPASKSPTDTALLSELNRIGVNVN